MKKESPMQTGGEPAASLSGIVGLSVLGVIVVLVAVWLYFQGKQSLAQPTAAQKLLATTLTADLARFRQDAWYLPNEPLLGFVEIPTGSFLMGSDPAIDTMAFENERWSLDRNQGTLNLPIFFIGRYEVTVAQFGAFVEATGYKFDREALHGAPDHPVVYVSWTDALAYSRWLQDQLKNSPQTPAQLRTLLREGWQVSVPSEAQWEKAARGIDGRIFPWGNKATREHANFRSAGTTPVGNFNCPACAFNLSDMSGNVWELTRSVYRPYPFNASDSADSHADALFVMRGGSFSDADNTIRAAVRGGIDPGARRAFIGFRVAITAD